MLGLFQADLPIGRRLWVLLLVLVISGALADGSVSFSENPISFVSDTLLFFGFITFLSLPIVMVLGLIGQIIECAIIHRRVKQQTYQSFVQNQPSELWLEILFNTAFVVAIIWAIPDFGSSTMRVGGVIGLSLFLFIELFDINVLFKETVELLELKKKESGKLSAKYRSENKVCKFKIVDSDWLAELVRLTENGWELIEINRNSPHSLATFQRFQQSIRLKIKRSKEHEKRTLKYDKRKKDNSPPNPAQADLLRSGGWWRQKQSQAHFKSVSELKRRHLPLLDPNARRHHSRRVRPGGPMQSR